MRPRKPGQPGTPSALPVSARLPPPSQPQAMQKLQAIQFPAHPKPAKPLGGPMNPITALPAPYAVLAAVNPTFTSPNPVTPAPARFDGPPSQHYPTPMQTPNEAGESLGPALPPLQSYSAHQLPPVNCMPPVSAPMPMRSAPQPPEPAPAAQYSVAPPDAEVKSYGNSPYPSSGFDEADRPAETWELALVFELAEQV